MYEQAVQVVVQDREASPAHLQQQLGISYNRAVNLLEDMEYAGIVSAPAAGGYREVLAPWHHE